MNATRATRKKTKFLAALEKTGNVSAAAKAAGVDRKTPYRWRDADPEFAAAWREAEEQATDLLEMEARRRALEGVEEPVYYQGQEVGTVRKYSDTLLIFLLKGNRPEKFKDRVAAEHSGPGGAPIQHEHNHQVDLSKLTPEELDALERIALRAQSSGPESDSG